MKFSWISRLVSKQPPLRTSEAASYLLTEAEINDRLESLIRCLKSEPRNEPSGLTFHDRHVRGLLMETHYPHGNMIDAIGEFTVSEIKAIADKSLSAAFLAHANNIIATSVDAYVMANLSNRAWDAVLRKTPQELSTDVMQLIHEALAVHSLPETKEPAAQLGK